MPEDQLGLVLVVATASQRCWRRWPVPDRIGRRCDGIPGRCARAPLSGPCYERVRPPSRCQTVRLTSFGTCPARARRTSRTSIRPGRIAGRGLSGCRPRGELSLSRPSRGAEPMRARQSWRDRRRESRGAGGPVGVAAARSRPYQGELEGVPVRRGGLDDRAGCRRLQHRRRVGDWSEQVGPAVMHGSVRMGDNERVASLPNTWPSLWGARAPKIEAWSRSKLRDERVDFVPASPLRPGKDGLVILRREMPAQDPNRGQAQRTRGE